MRSLLLQVSLWAPITASVIDLTTVYASFGASPPYGTVITVSEVAPGLRGMAAATSINRGGLLLRMPLSSCLTCPRGPEDDVELSRLLLTALVDADSPEWLAYSELLPHSMDAAMLWQPEEIAELQIPQACEYAASLRERILESANTAYHSLEDWRWAMAIVYSRSLVIEAPDGDLFRALIPFLDMCNHEPESPVEYAARWSEREAFGEEDEPDSPWRLTSDGHVELRAEAPISSHAEIRVPYGTETSAELLVTSGFVPAPNSADYIPLFDDLEGLVQHVAGSHHLTDDQVIRRLAYLEELDASEAPLAVRPGGLAASGHLLACTQLLVARDDELQCFSERYVEAAGHHTLVLVPSPELSLSRVGEIEAAAATECMRAARSLLSSYPTTAASDEAQLARLKTANGEDSDGRLAVALGYRLSVKQLLGDFMTRCAELASQAATQGEQLADL